MATYIEYLQYKRNLKWYKRILWPLFLSKDEIADFVDKFSKRTVLDEMRDRCYICWKRYYDDPSYDNKRDFEKIQLDIRYMEEKEMFKKLSDEEKMRYLEDKNVYNGNIFII